MNNIELFNVHLARAIGRLFEAHPRTVMLGSNELWKPQLTKEDIDYDAKAEASGGALLWLYRNGLVTGELTEMDGGPTVLATA